MKKIFVLILVILTVMGFSGCSSEGGKAKAERIITIGVMPDVDSIPFIMAENRGFFKKEGVKVKLEYFKSAKDRDSAFHSGKLDGAIADILTVIFNKDGGFDVKITSKTDGNYKLLVGKNSGIKAIKDIKGRSIAISKNTLIEYSSDKILEGAGLNGNDVHKVIVPQIPVRLEMLQNGKVDSATLPEPLASLAIKNGARVLASTQEQGIRPGVIMFSTNIIKSNASDIEAVYKAYNDSVEFLNSTPVSTYIDVLIKNAGFPAPVKDSLVLPHYDKAKMIMEKDFNEVDSWLSGKGLIKKSYQFKDSIDDSFVR